MIRKIPATMVSQHPDHAGRPFWHSQEFIATSDEVNECFISFSELGVSEYKWDWEGKFVDESVIERLFSGHFEYFKNFPLGKEKFLTFRLPNPKVETEFRLGRAFMGILGAAGLAKEVGIHNPPLFEVILPMTESAEEMIAIQEAFSEVASLKHQLYNFEKGGLKHIEMIPLFEQADVIAYSHKILDEYFQLHRLKFGFTPTYIRPYLARSDPALNSGLVPTVLAIKISLSRYRKLEKKTGIKLYPIIGSGSLPFRGGLTPETVDHFCQEYRGIRTALLQSAFRYDYDKTKVLKAIKKLEKTLPYGEAISVSESEEKELRELTTIFESFYQQTVEGVAPLINEVASYLPKRRERVQHIGLFGYSRGIGKVKLPRAIGFTGALYSLGIPPEIIGTGRGLEYAIKTGKLELLEKFYIGLKRELEMAGWFLNKKELEKLARKSEAWNGVLKDVCQIESYLGKNLGPVRSEEIEYANIVKELHQKVMSGRPFEGYLSTLASLRRSIG